MVTAAAVAWTAHLMGLDSKSAWIIGAAVAPTDATAVAALARGLNRRTLTVLRAESLINDGTALVVYALALEVAEGTGQVTFWHVSWMFLVSFVGGALIGLAVGWPVTHLRHHLEQPVLMNTLSLLTPFVAYLLAELIHASGVLAVVACGLYVSQKAPRAISAQARSQGSAIWTMLSFILNGTLFVLVGLQLPALVRGLTTTTLTRAVAVAAVVYLSIPVIRWVFLNVSIYVIRALDRRPQQRERRTSAGHRLTSAVAGFRGAVSLAIALSVPVTLHGEPFPGRDVIVFVTAFVVVASLIVQGLLLPRVIRWSRLPSDQAMDDELHTAQITAVETALKKLPHLAEENGTPEDIVDRVREQYQEHLDELRSGTEDEARRTAQLGDIELAMIRVKREAIVRLRDENVIDDTVLRQLQAGLDAEEVRLQPPAELE